MLDESMEVTLFHGTSTYFSRLLRDGAEVSPLYKHGALTLAPKVYNLLISSSKDLGSICDLFPDDCPARIAAPIALKNITENTQDSLISYGLFYASLFREIAASYAVQNNGSELTLILRESILAIERKNPIGIGDLRRDFPNLSHILETDHTPIILVLENVPIRILEQENGRPLTREFVEFQREMNRAGVRTPGSVRFKGHARSYLSKALAVRLLNDVTAPRDSDFIFQDIDLNAL